MTDPMTGIIAGWIGLASALVAMALVLARLVRGPSVHDSILAANALASSAIVALVALGFVGARPDFHDIALVYALVGFVLSLAALRFWALARQGEAPRRINPQSAADQADTIKADTIKPAPTKATPPQ